MALLRLASKETKRITIGDDPADFIEVRVDVSKRDFNNLIHNIPTTVGDAGLTPGEADDFTRFLFELFVVGWSLKDDDGNTVIPTSEMYLSLSREAALAIDTALVEHFNTLTPSDGERRKSEDAGE